MASQFCPTCANQGLLSCDTTDAPAGEALPCLRCGSSMAPVPEWWVRRLADETQQNSGRAKHHPVAIVGRVRRAPAGPRSKTTCLQLVTSAQTGAELLPPKGETLDVCWGDRAEGAWWRVTVGHSSGNPAWFHQRLRPTHGQPGTFLPTTTAALLARHGLGDEVHIEIDPKARQAWIPIRQGATETPDADGRLPVARDHSLQVPALEPRITQLMLRRAPAMVRRYNKGRFLDRRNVELDAEGYRRFARGPSRDLQTLTDDLAFVGRFYGGTRVGLLPEGSWKAEAQRIATQLIEDRDTYDLLLRDCRPLTDHLPTVKTTLRLVEPFHTSRSWMVWATKALHFLAPATFPQLDAAVEAALGLTRNRYEAHYYVGYMTAYRRALERFAEVLPELRDIDQRTRDADAPAPDLKILDKVLYELGRQGRHR